MFGVRNSVSVGYWLGNSRPNSRFSNEISIEEVSFDIKSVFMYICLPSLPFCFSNVSSFSLAIFLSSKPSRTLVVGGYTIEDINILCSWADPSYLDFCRALPSSSRILLVLRVALNLANCERNFNLFDGVHSCGISNGWLCGGKVTRLWIT